MNKNIIENSAKSSTKRCAVQERRRVILWKRRIAKKISRIVNAANNNEGLSDALYVTANGALALQRLNDYENFLDNLPIPTPPKLVQKIIGRYDEFAETICDSYLSSVSDECEK